VTVRLVAAYQAGARVEQLAAQFGIHRLTVSGILQREGVTMRPRGIHADDLPDVIRLYRDGWSLARLAAEFDVSPSTVTSTLRRAGVPIRRPGRLPGEGLGRVLRIMAHVSAARSAAGGVLVLDLATARPSSCVRRQRRI
jgi:uncharacterized protein (DUF433 family)